MSNQEVLDVLLECFLTFTNMEPPTSHMNKFFLILQKISMDVTANPHQNFMTRVPHGTIDKTIEVIMHLKDYMTM